MHTMRKQILLFAVGTGIAACSTQEPLFTDNKPAHADYCKNNPTDDLCRPIVASLDKTNWTLLRSDFILTLETNRPVVKAWDEFITLQVEQEGKILDLGQPKAGDFADTFVVKVSFKNIVDTFGRKDQKGNTLIGGAAKLIVTFHGSDGTLTPSEVNVIFPNASSFVE